MRRAVLLDWLAGALLAAVVIVVWWPALGASFQFDDWNVIVRDPRVQSPAAWLDSMPGIRPLLKLSFALNHALDAGPAAFRAFNLLSDSYRGDGYDAIFCRNVMIYFDRPMQRRVLEKLHACLRPDGLLFVGHSENFTEQRDLFSLVGKTVYTRAKA